VRAPRNFGRVTHGIDLDAVTVDDEIAAFGGDRARELAMGGIVLGQMGIGFGIAQIVDGDHLDFIRTAGFIEGAHYIAADAAIAVDGNFDGH